MKGHKATTEKCIECTFEFGPSLVSIVDSRKMHVCALDPKYRFKLLLVMTPFFLGCRHCGRCAVNPFATIHFSFVWQFCFFWFRFSAHIH